MVVWASHKKQLRYTGVSNSMPNVADEILDEDGGLGQLVEKISLKDRSIPAVAKEISAQNFETDKDQICGIAMQARGSAPQQYDVTDGRQMFTKDQKYAFQVEADSRSIFVGNITGEVTPEIIEEHFQTCGIVKRITLLYDKNTGAPKGYAYVEFQDESAREKALHFNGTELKGKSISVHKKRTNLPRYRRNASYPKQTTCYQQQSNYPCGREFHDFKNLDFCEQSYQHIAGGNYNRGHPRGSHREAKRRYSYRNLHKGNYTGENRSPPPSELGNEKMNSQDDENEATCLTTEVHE